MTDTQRLMAILDRRAADTANHCHDSKRNRALRRAAWEAQDAQCWVCNETIVDPDNGCHLDRVMSGRDRGICVDGGACNDPTREYRCRCRYTFGVVAAAHDDCNYERDAHSAEQTLALLPRVPTAAAIATHWRPRERTRAGK